MEKNNYLINFTIGDWSGDGHSQKDSFIVKSSHPVEYLREVHFKSKEILGFDIGDLFRDYGQNFLTKDIQEKLEVLGIIDQDTLDDEGVYVAYEPEEVLYIWLDCLEAIDNTLFLELKKEDSIPSMHFFGQDALNRHLYVPGYGIYD